MPAERGPNSELRNETAVNVAGLLREQTGATREYQLWLDWLALADGLLAEDIEGEVRLTRLRAAVIAAISASGVASLECVRCLRFYEQPFSTRFDEEFVQTVDLRTGVGLDRSEDDDDADTARIDENHILDFGDVLRQEIILALPMRPDCGDACPGPPGDTDADNEPVDSRFAALGQLLDESDAVVDRSGDNGRKPKR